MIRSIGLLDRAVVTALATGIVTLYLSDRITDLTAAALGMLALFYLVISAASSSPLFSRPLLPFLPAGEGRASSARPTLK